jgi:hypothetical protein
MIMSFLLYYAMIIRGNRENPSNPPIKKHTQRDGFVGRECEPEDVHFTHRPFIGASLLDGNKVSGVI